MSKEFVQKFTAKDADGNAMSFSHFVEVARLVPSDPAIRGKKSVVPGSDSVETLPCGRSVNILEKGKYQLVVSGLVYASDDPKSP